MLKNNTYQRNVFKLAFFTALMVVFTMWVYQLESSIGDTATKLLNFAIPFFFLLAFGMIGTKLIKRDAMLMWTPAAMFCLCTKQGISLY